MQQSGNGEGLEGRHHVLMLLQLVGQITIATVQYIKTDCMLPNHLVLLQAGYDADGNFVYTAPQ